MAQGGFDRNPVERSSLQRWLNSILIAWRADVRRYPFSVFSVHPVESSCRGQ